MHLLNISHHAILVVVAAVVVVAIAVVVILYLYLRHVSKKNLRSHIFILTSFLYISASEYVLYGIRQVQYFTAVGLLGCLYFFFFVFCDIIC